MAFVLQKLLRGRIWQRIAVERLADPLHIVVASLVVMIFGSFRMKVAFDLVVRQHVAWGLLRAADTARANGLRSFTAIEFGVATGAGLLNMAQIAARVTKETGVGIQVVGFDTGTGMPPAQDYRDHPDLYQHGDFAMDEAALRPSLPGNVGLIVGDIAETVPRFMESMTPESPIGFVVVDVDYYSSTVDALRLFDSAADRYLPITVLYLDDISLPEHNQLAGQLLAVREFNDRNTRRRIEQPRFLRADRLIQRSRWISHIYFLHVLDHDRRARVAVTPDKRQMHNPYLGDRGGREKFEVGTGTVDDV